MSIKFKKLNNSIVKCRSCPRLIAFSKKISIEKRKKNISETYWAKPVTGFGDINLVLVTHYVLIQEVLNITSSSGELIIADKNFNVLARQNF